MQPYSERPGARGWSRPVLEVYRSAPSGSQRRETRNAMPPIAVSLGVLRTSYQLGVQELDETASFVGGCKALQRPAPLCPSRGNVGEWRSSLLCIPKWTTCTRREAHTGDAGLVSSTLLYVTRCRAGQYCTDAGMLGSGWQLTLMAFRPSKAMGQPPRSSVIHCNAKRVQVRKSAAQAALVVWCHA